MSRAPNSWVAGQLGISESGASRLRGGSRKPGRLTVATVARVLGFSVEDQYAALGKSKYHSELEKHITKAYKENSK